jgi:hypothetical protein
MAVRRLQVRAVSAETRQARRRRACNVQHLVRQLDARLHVARGHRLRGCTNGAARVQLQLGIHGRVRPQLLPVLHVHRALQTRAACVRQGCMCAHATTNTMHNMPSRCRLSRLQPRSARGRTRACSARSQTACCRQAGTSVGTRRHGGIFRRCQCRARPAHCFSCMRHRGVSPSVKEPNSLIAVPFASHSCVEKACSKQLSAKRAKQRTEQRAKQLSAPSASSANSTSCRRTAAARTASRAAALRRKHRVFFSEGLRTCCEATHRQLAAQPRAPPPPRRASPPSHALEGSREGRPFFLCVLIGSRTVHCPFFPFPFPPLQQCARASPRPDRARCGLRHAASAGGACSKKLKAQVAASRAAARASCGRHGRGAVHQQRGRAVTPTPQRPGCRGRCGCRQRRRARRRRRCRARRRRRCTASRACCRAAPQRSRAQARRAAGARRSSFFAARALSRLGALLTSCAAPTSC